MDDGGGSYYPEDQSPFRAKLAVRYERFAELREAVLLDYGFHTAVAYWVDLDDLMRWCFANDVDVLNPQPADAARYLDELRERRYSPNTIARRLTAMRRFYNHLVEDGELTRSPVADLHEPRRRASRRTKPRPRRLSRAQRQRLIDAAAQNPRDHALARLLIDGVTVAQLCRAQTEDLVQKDNVTMLHARDRGVPKVITLSPETISVLHGYLRGRTGSLFTDHEGRPLDRFDVRRVVTCLSRQAGFKRAVRAEEL